MAARAGPRRGARGAAAGARSVEEDLTEGELAAAAGRGAGPGPGAGAGGAGAPRAGPAGPGPPGRWGRARLFLWEGWAETAWAAALLLGLACAGVWLLHHSRAASQTLWHIKSMHAGGEL